MLGPPLSVDEEVTLLWGILFLSILLGPLTLIPPA